MTPETQLSFGMICRRIDALKGQEARAKDERHILEAELEKLLADELPDEGSKTVNADGFKIKATRKLTRSLDIEKATPALHCIPKDYRPIKVVVDEGKLKKLERQQYDLFATISRHVTTKPAKTGFVITRLEEAG